MYISDQSTADLICTVTLIDYNISISILNIFFMTYILISMLSVEGLKCGTGSRSGTRTKIQ